MTQSIADIFVVIVEDKTFLLSLNCLCENIAQEISAHKNTAKTNLGKARLNRQYIKQAKCISHSRPETFLGVALDFQFLKLLKLNLLFV